MKRIAALLVLILALVFSNAPASAQSCSFTMPDIDFGDIDLTLNTTFTTSVTFQVTCTGTPNARVRICPHFGSGSGGNSSTGNPRYMLNGATQLNYNIYRNAAMSQVWGSLFWGRPPTPPTITFRLNGAGTGTSNFTAYGRVNAGQTTKPAGVYVSSFAGGHTLVAYAYTSVGNCTAIGTSNATQVPFTVRARNTGTCSVVATTLDFGSKGVLDASVDAQSQLSVTCTSGAAYTVGLSGGNSGATNPTLRKMSLGANQVTYGIYRNAARTQPWGSTIGTDTIAGTGTGSATVIPVYGRVPAQTTPVPGTYTDTIVVTVTY
ncbi:MAG: spore coat protein U domain-containing protein [Hyphomicrobiaceae bacterium]